MFLPLGRHGERRRFAVLHKARSGNAKGLVVHAPAFAEEMNKSRRMVAVQARALCAGGWTVLRPDLLGCGDSEGDLTDATWEAWVDDLADSCRWLREHEPAAANAPLVLWGLRMGALLAQEVAIRLGDVDRLLLWQPVTNGAQALQQFLRIGTASQLMAGDAVTSAQDKPAAVLASGRTVEIGGYLISPALAGGLETARFSRDVPVRRIDWFEVGAEAGSLPAAASRFVQAWREEGRDIQVQSVTGPPFWRTNEIEDAEHLVASTCRAMGVDVPPSLQ